MLVLTRKLKQQIHIGSNITVTILRIQGNSVRIGIEAPSDVRILRSELADELEFEAQEEVAPSKSSASIRTLAAAPASPGEHATAARRSPLAEAVSRRRAPRAGTTTATPASIRLGPATRLVPSLAVNA